MVNLYDSPAQANFINTYVPIQFENLYKVADKAQKNLDEAEALQDELVSKYGILNTPSIADKATFTQKVSDRINAFAQARLTDPEALKDPLVQAEGKSLSRQIKSDPWVASAMANAPLLRDFSKKSDPRFGDIEKNKAKNYVTSPGSSFDEENVKYTPWGESAKPLVDQLEMTILGKSEVPKNIYKPGYNYTGITGKRITGAIDAGSSTFVNDPSDIMKAENDFQAGKIPSQYLKKDTNGNVIGYNPQYIVDKSKFAWKDKEHYAESLDPYYLEAIKRSHAQTATPGATGQALWTEEVRGQHLNTVSQQKANRVLEVTAKEMASRRPGQSAPDGGFTFGEEGLAYTRLSAKIAGLKEQRKNVTQQNTPEGKKQLDDIDAQLFGARNIYENTKSNAVARYQDAEDRAMTGGTSKLAKEVIETDNRSYLDPTYVTNTYNDRYLTTPRQFKVSAGSIINGYPGVNTSEYVVSHHKGMAPLLPEAYEETKLVSFIQKGSSSSAIFSPGTMATGTVDGKLANKGFVFIPKDELDGQFRESEIKALMKKGLIEEITYTTPTKVVDQETREPSMVVLPIGAMYKIPVTSKIAESSIKRNSYQGATFDKKHPITILN